MKTQKTSFSYKDLLTQEWITTIVVLVNLLLVFSLSSCTEQKEDSIKAITPQYVTDRSTSEDPVIGYFSEGEYTINLSFDEGQQVLDVILEAQNTSGQLTDMYIDDQPDLEGAEAYLVLVGETESGTVNTYGIFIEQLIDPNGTLTYTISDAPAHLERKWMCIPRECGGACLSVRGPWYQGYRIEACACSTGGPGCDFAAGGGGSWILGAVTLIRFLLQ